MLREGQPVLRLRLEHEETVMGRDPSVDLYIPDARVSRRHCVIQRLDGPDGSVFRLVDRSSNGTFLNGNRARATRLSDQDLITLGDCQLRFEQDDGELPGDTVMVSKEGGSLAYDPTGERFHYLRPVLMVKSAPGMGKEGPVPPQRIPLRFDTTRIGSDPRGSVCLAGLAPEHCQLLAVSDGYVLRSLHLRPFPMMAGQVVVEEALINPGMTIELGPYQLQLELESGDEPLIPLNVPLFEGMVGTTPSMHKLFALIERFARHDAPVVILGETGTGKELVARALHTRGHRARGPFVALNCSAITPQLFESELFGHTKGAFTGAVRDKVGAFEAADQGTLFLDELGELPLEQQAKLLRVLETSTVTPVGAHQARPINVRVVAATHRDLPRLVEAGRFRADLLFRLLVLSITLPPLRSRPEDILPLAQHFLSQLAQGSTPPRLTPDAQQRLKAWHFPGNVRELRHALTRAVASASTPKGMASRLTEADLSFLSMDLGAEAGARTLPVGATSDAALSGRLEGHERVAGGVFGAAFAVPGAGLASGSSPTAGAQQSLDELEKQAILQALKNHDNNRSEAARALGIARSTLHVRMRRFGIG